MNASVESRYKTFFFFSVLGVSTASKTEVGRDDVKTPWRCWFVKLKICLPLLQDLYWNCSSRQWLQSLEKSKWLFWWSWPCKPGAASAVTKLYEVRAKPEAEDTQLRTGSDTVSPGRGRNWRKKKNLKGSENPLKSVFSGRSRGSDSFSGSRSLIDCRFQFLTVYISVYNSRASHVLGVCCKDLSKDVSSRQRYKILVGQMLSPEMTFLLWFCMLLRLSCWPNNPCETDGKQIKKRPSACILSDYITLTLRLFNEPCTDI